jgi:transcriptional regulator with XRE-family HTH domain
LTTALPEDTAVWQVVAMTALDKILLLIDELDLTQGEVEIRAGLSEGKIRKWKKGEHKPPTRGQCLKIADALGVPRSRLVDEPATLVPPARLHLEQLIATHGVDRCVAWIIEGANPTPKHKVGPPPAVAKQHVVDVPPASEPKRRAGSK